MYGWLRVTLKVSKTEDGKTTVHDKPALIALDQVVTMHEGDENQTIFHMLNGENVIAEDTNFDELVQRMSEAMSLGSLLG